MSISHVIRVCHFKSDGFEKLRQFVGHVHNEYCPERAEDLPQIVIHSRDLNSKELNEMSVWDGVQVLKAFDRACIQLSSLSFTNDLACSIRARPGAIHFVKIAQLGVKSLGKQTVCIGVPTSSRKIPFVMDQPVISILLPSLLKSLTHEERQAFHIHVMIVFDEGDFYFDKTYFRSLLLEEIGSLIKGFDVHVSIYRVKPVNRVLYLWNWMYDQSMQSSDSYFYQLNDDAHIHGSGWLTDFVENLSTIAYPSDSKKFGCKLPCQVFTDRRHYDRFGWLFPPEIQDWHGDTFLGLLYHDRSHCDHKHSVWNGRPGKLPSRYRPCRSVDFSRLLKHYRPKMMARGM